MESKDILNTPVIIADAETSGKSPFFDQHLSSAKIRIHEDKVRDTFYQECRCENSRIPSPRALFVNGLSTKTLSEGQPLNNLLKADYDFVSKYPDDFILAHNAKFDLAFLNAELAICGEPKVEDLVEDVIDSLDLARKLNPGKKNSLDVLCSRYNVDNSDRSLHGALLDAELLAKVYLVMTRGQEKLNIQQKNQIKFDSNNKSTITNKDVVIKYASKFENTLHKSFLEKMKKDCEEKVLWSEDKKE